MAAPKYKQIEASLILVNRDERQRRELKNIDSLADSIKRLGLINPITIRKDYTLIAGERRLEACRSLDENYKIPCRFYEELDDIQLQLIELEENVKRDELSWQDTAISIKRIHDLYITLDPQWTAAKTAETMGLSAGWVSSNTMIATRIAAGDEKIIRAESITVARNIVTRENERAIDNELNNLIETEREETTTNDTTIQSSNSGGTAALTGQAPITQVREPDIIQGDFNLWVKSYEGRRFNLIHCDFPYGIDHGESDQGGTASGRFEGYADGEEVYWELVNSLCRNIDSLMTPSGHVMFWFSMKFYNETVRYFREHSDLTLVMEHPLIWYKSDGRGIVSDVNRRPRNVYETALLFSRGDRKILTPVDNCYACPTSKSKALHVSEKPEPMLRHFFRLFIDGYSELLDPTCGAGSSIRAADSLGAKRVLGLELNKEFAEEANLQLRRSRTLDRLSSTLGDDL